MSYFSEALVKFLEINNYIVDKLGGKITVSSTFDGGFRLEWAKEDERFQMLFSYLELEQLVDPILIAVKFVDNYYKEKGE